MTILFGDFLESEIVYRECERYWRDLIQEIETTLGQSEEWKAWHARTYGDGVTPLPLDGNPIADGKSDEIGRGFRVIQCLPDAGFEPTVGAYIESHDDPIYEGSIFPDIEMTIVLTLTDETVQKARELLTCWMDPRRSVAETESLISRLVGE